MELIKQHKGLAVGVAALVVIGALWAGVPASTLLLFALVLACPLMMMTMHGGGGHGGHERGGGIPRRDPHSSNGTGSNGTGPTEPDPHAAHRLPADTSPR